MKKLILILAALTCACSWAGVTSARLGALGRNDTVVTNVTDVTPGNYETVSNRAMSASAYTDAALGAFASTGAVTRVELHGTPTRWTDATGCVWQVVGGGGGWSVYTNSILVADWSAYSYQTDVGPGGYFYELRIGPINEAVENFYSVASGVFPTASPVWADEYEKTFDSDAGFYGLTNGDAIRVVRGGTNLVGRVALTNDIPRTAGDVGAYPAASGSALESGKQDRLPYPTNAIPFSVIDGAPSGGQAWNVSTQDCDFLQFVTNGMAHVRWWDSNTTCISDMAAWPDGASMMVRFVKQQPITSWSVDSNIHLVGYGTWPTNNFQSVWWRSGTNIYVNVILEE